MGRHLPAEEQQALTDDARNRAARTLLQSLAVDVALAVAGVIATSVGSLDLTSREQLTTVGLLVAKSVLAAVASFVMRRFLDGSAVPTPATAPLPVAVTPEGAYIVTTVHDSAKALPTAAIHPDDPPPVLDGP